MGLAAIGHHKLAGSVTAGDVFWKSAAIGRRVKRFENALVQIINGANGKQAQSSPNVGSSDKLPIVN
jgi:hypothetical protein